MSVPWQQCTWNDRLKIKKVHHVGVYLMKVHDLNRRTISLLTIYLFEVLPILPTNGPKNTVSKCAQSTCGNPVSAALRRLTLEQTRFHIHIHSLISCCITLHTSVMYDLGPCNSQSYGILKTSGLLQTTILRGSRAFLYSNLKWRY